MNGKTATVWVSNFTRIAVIHKFISKQEGIKDIRLVSGWRNLTCKFCIGDYNIREGNTLYSLQRLRGGTDQQQVNDFEDRLLQLERTSMWPTRSACPCS